MTLITLELPRLRRTLSRKVPEKKYSTEHAERIRRAIDDLSEDPRPHNSRKLQGREGYRLRVGDYRIIYRVYDEAREIFVAEVWHRQRDYR